MVDDAAPARGRALSRRAVLGGAATLAGLAATALGGCSVERPGTRAAPPRSPAELAPDVSVATTALADVGAVAAAVTATAARFPGLTPDLAGLVALHRAHVASLVDAVPVRARPSATSTPAAYVVPRDRDRALTAIAVREQQLHDTLGALALRAQSGDFARLLASMGAAIGQRLVGLTR